MAVQFFCVDGLSGFREAIEAVYPYAQTKRCIIHMLRNSSKYVSYKNFNPFASDFKPIYKASSEEVALKELEDVKEKWGKKYPYSISNWESNWDVVSQLSLLYDDRLSSYLYHTNIPSVIKLLPYMYKIYPRSGLGSAQGKGRCLYL